MKPEQLRRILIVDDNQSIHEDIRKLLGPLDLSHSKLNDTEALLFGNLTNEEKRVCFEIDSAYQGQEGSELVKKAVEEMNPYAMAFVDMRMPPGWDGVKTAQAIWEADPEIQVIICTAFSDYAVDEIIGRTHGAGRLSILKKPFDVNEAVQLACSLAEKRFLNLTKM